MSKAELLRVGAVLEGNVTSLEVEELLITLPNGIVVVE